MWRYLAGAVAALLLASAGLFWFNSGAANRVAQRILPAVPQTAEDPGALPDTVPEASAKTREQKRFGRYDKDKDGSITRDEYLASRRKAFAKLDTNGDGKLSFDEWAIKATTKFATADKDKSGALTPAEFATTAVVRKARPKAKCACPPTVAAAPAGEEAN
jgi:hypothetical protein